MSYKDLNLRFKKNESFYIRDGWLEKAINSIFEHNEENIFSKNNGTAILGIGSNMVKSLKYWLQASNLMAISSTKSDLTFFGELILKYDQYFESSFSWFLIHYFLATNEEYCPVFYAIFNSNAKLFSKNDGVNIVYAFYKTQGIDVKRDYIEDDMGVFLKTYYNDEIINNPEDNYVCPLSNLLLLSKRKDIFEKKRPVYSELNYLIVYYALSVLYSFKPFNIEDSIEAENSPVRIFNLDKNAYLQYLEEMRKNHLITINKTAGLNTIYFEKKLSLEEIFDLHFGG